RLATTARSDDDKELSSWDIDGDAIKRDESRRAEVLSHAGQGDLGLWSRHKPVVGNLNHGHFVFRFYLGL
ncbi:hypothetical protein QIH21_27025, partial [Klebsiella pneumoniae]|nr:hypothetical protein [Klebsiella pneumoniae]